MATDLHTPIWAVDHGDGILVPSFDSFEEAIELAARDAFNDVQDCDVVYGSEIGGFDVVALVQPVNHADVPREIADEFEIELVLTVVDKSKVPAQLVECAESEEPIVVVEYRGKGFAKHGITSNAWTYVQIDDLTRNPARLTAKGAQMYKHVLASITLKADATKKGARILAGRTVVGAARRGVPGLVRKNPDTMPLVGDAVTVRVPGDRPWFGEVVAVRPWPAQEADVQHTAGGNSDIETVFIDHLHLHGGRHTSRDAEVRQAKEERREQSRARRRSDRGPRKTRGQREHEAQVDEDLDRMAAMERNPPLTARRAPDFRDSGNYEVTDESGAVVAIIYRDPGDGTWNRGMFPGEIDRAHSPIEHHLGYTKAEALEAVAQQIASGRAWAVANPAGLWTKPAVRAGWPETWEREIRGMWYTIEARSGGGFSVGYSHRRGDSDSVERGSSFRTLEAAQSFCEEHAGLKRNPFGYRVPTLEEIASAWRYIEREYTLKEGNIDGEQWAEGLAFGYPMEDLKKVDPSWYRQLMSDAQGFQPQLTADQWSSIAVRADRLRADQGEPRKFKQNPHSCVCLEPHVTAERPQPCRSCGGTVVSDDDEFPALKRGPGGVAVGIMTPGEYEASRGEAVDLFKTFHRREPKDIGEFHGSLTIPSRLKCIGPAKWTTYRSDKVDPATLKKPRKPVNYIHEHNAGVDAYVITSDADFDDIDGDVVDVPQEYRAIGALTKLGESLGFCVKVGDGELEVENESPLPELYAVAKADGSHACLYVIQDKREVLAMIWGGALGVFARGIDG